MTRATARAPAVPDELIAFHGSEMANIIEDLLVWARGDIGEVHVTCRPMDLSDAVRQTLRAMPHLEIPIRDGGSRLTAVADPGRVRQIVRNLATNTLRYGGDSIEVRIGSDDRTAIIEVSDNGPEIPLTVRSRMFEPYERARTPSSQPGSIGLGLTVARTLARLQQGDLVCVREGSRNMFRLTLPLAPADTRDVELEKLGDAVR